MSLFAIAASWLNAAEARLGVAAQDNEADTPPPAPANTADTT